MKEEDQAHDPPPLWGTPRVARRLGVEPETVCGLVRAGKLQAVLVGRAYRFEPAAVEAYLGNCRKRKPGVRRRRGPSPNAAVEPM